MDFETGNKYIQLPGADIRPTEKAKAPCGKTAGPAGAYVREQRRRYIPRAMAAACVADRKRPRVMFSAEKAQLFLLLESHGFNRGRMSKLYRNDRSRRRL